MTITVQVTPKTQEEEEEGEEEEEEEEGGGGGGGEEEEVWHYSERCYIYGYVRTLKFPRLYPLVLLVNSLEVR